MKDSKTSPKVPSFIWRVWSVWYRHYSVYLKNILTNGLPPFLDPLIFLAGIGIGLGMFIGRMEGVSYIEFLASGLLVSTAMFTAAYECSFGTFIRLEFDKIYDGMIAAPLSAGNIFLGEILWAGTKGFFFTMAVLIIVKIFGFIPGPMSYFTPLVGLLTGMMFGAFALLITSFVKSIDQFNFLFTGFLSPMFFFSGIFFSLQSMPPAIKVLAEFLPLTHAVRLARVLCFGNYGTGALLDLLYSAVFIIVFSYFGIRRLEKKVID
jgi:lipooligosaccharide transport system permease protein